MTPEQQAEADRNPTALDNRKLALLCRQVLRRRPIRSRGSPALASASNRRDSECWPALPGRVATLPAPGEPFRWRRFPALPAAERLEPRPLAERPRPGQPAPRGAGSCTTMHPPQRARSMWQSGPATNSGRFGSAKGKRHMMPNANPRIAILLLAIAAWVPAVEGAEPEPGSGSSRVGAESEPVNARGEYVRRAVELAAEQPADRTPARRRSMVRTWAGVGLVAGGAVLAVMPKSCRLEGALAPDVRYFNYDRAQNCPGCSLIGSFSASNPVVTKGNDGNCMLDFDVHGSFRTLRETSLPSAGLLVILEV